MHVKRRPATVAAGFLTAAGLVAASLAAGGPSAVAANWAAARPAAAAAEPVAGTGTATARSVSVVSAAISRPGLAAASPGPILGKNGKPAGPAAATAASTSRPASPSLPARSGGRDAALSPTTVTAVPRASATSATAAAELGSDPSFTGATEANSAGSGPTPYVSGAVNSTQIAETVNLSLQVFSKSGTSLCSESLAGLLGALGGLTEPRIQYDNVAKRFSLVVASLPSTSSDVPVFYLATSESDTACGAWWVYSIILTGNQYPLGAQLNYPYLGQDSTSLLASTNNFTFGSSYLGTGAFAMPKSAAYTGNPFNITTYSVDFSTAPPTVAGIPTESTTTTYWLAAVPGTGFDVFSMPTNPAGAISYVGTVSDPFSPPSREARQPGTSDTLNTLDGRIQSSVAQDGNEIWFANDVDDDGYPTVLYGAINGINGDISDALAFHGDDSDDFNPSIAVSPQAGGTDDVWVNWVYTQASSGVPASDTINGASVRSGGDVPELEGTDLTLVTGVSATSISTFGAYSSVEIDPVASSSSCAAGLTALSTQEYFTSASQWGTLLAETSFC
jgi:hypothetical protein